MAEPEKQVTICVPVYNGAAFVAETLSSIQKQSHAGLTVLISVDSSTDESAATCKCFLRDERFQVVEQEQRLGWVGNCNWLLSRVRTPYFCIIPHDDIIEPSYVDRLLATAEAQMGAAVVYCDIQGFGTVGNRIISQPSIQGTPLKRALTFLTEHFNAVAFRGLVRLTSARSAGPFQSNPFDDFAEDTVWLMKLGR
jgi:glycosyltransferase involved in cell wall biosynthesis